MGTIKIARKCKDCGKWKDINEYPSYIIKNDRRYKPKCKVCTKKYQQQYLLKLKEEGKSYYETHKKQCLKTQTLYRKNNKEAVKKSRIKYTLKNKEKLRIQVNKLQAKYRQELSDTYIKAILFGLGIKKYTPEMIEAKRNQLKLYRHVKNL